METKKPRGFGCMSPERRREIARKGGQTGHRLGRAHQWTPDEGREAGLKGKRLVRERRAALAGT